MGEAEGGWERVREAGGGWERLGGSVGEAEGGWERLGRMGDIKWRVSNCGLMEAVFPTEEDCYAISGVLLAISGALKSTEQTRNTNLNRTLAGTHRAVRGNFRQ
jgi:hypothetical protein